LIEISRLLLAVFALYRLASLISSEEGPYIGWPRSEQQIRIFKAIRMRLGAYTYGPDSRPETNLGRGISCPLCTAAYLGLFLLILIRNPTQVGDLLLLWLGIWGAQTFLENLTAE